MDVGGTRERLTRVNRECKNCRFTFKEKKKPALYFPHVVPSGVTAERARPSACGGTAAGQDRAVRVRGQEQDQDAWGRLFKCIY